MKFPKSILLLLLSVTLFACQSKRQKAENKFSEGIKLCDSVKYDNAITLFQEAIKIDTSFSRAKYSLANCYLEQKNYDGAINTLGSIKNKQVSNDSIYLLFTKVYLQKEDWGKSIEYADKLIAVNPNSFEAHLLKGKSLYNKAIHATGNLELLKKALENATIANKIKPNNNECLMLRGIVRFGINDYEGSIKDLNIVVSQEKKDSSTLGTSYRFIGLSLSKQLKLKEALSYLDTALTYSPNTGIIYYNRGFVKIDLKMSDGACDDFRKALELGETDAVDVIQIFCKDKSATN